MGDVDEEARVSEEVRAAPACEADDVFVWCPESKEGVVDEEVFVPEDTKPPTEEEEEEAVVAEEETEEVADEVLLAPEDSLVFPEESPA